MEDNERAPRFVWKRGDLKIGDEETEEEKEKKRSHHPERSSTECSTCDAGSIDATCLSDRQT